MSAASSSSAGVSSPTAASTTADAETLRRNRIMSSKLYFDVPPSKVPLIYSSSYDIAFLGIEKLHPFDSSKWGRICKFLIIDGVLDKNHVVEPLEATKDDLLVVHSDSYLNSLKSSLTVSIIVEVPPVALLPNCLVQQKVLHPFRKQVKFCFCDMSVYLSNLMTLPHSRLEEASWQQSLRRREVGLSMLVVASIIVVEIREGGFVFMQTYLFVFIMHLSG
ncbi:histone deacetylase [Sarracenia purpurea var. burkii]